MKARSFLLFLFLNLLKLFSGQFSVQHSGSKTARIMGESVRRGSWRMNRNIIESEIQEIQKNKPQTWLSLQVDTVKPVVTHTKRRGSDPISERVLRQRSRTFYLQVRCRWQVVTTTTTRMGNPARFGCSFPPEIWVKTEESDGWSNNWVLLQKQMQTAEHRNIKPRVRHWSRFTAEVKTSPPASDLTTEQQLNENLTSGVTPG